MTTDAARVNAQAMSLTRRSAFAIIGAALITTCHATFAESADQSLEAIDALIAAQTEAYRISEAKQEAASEIEDSLLADMPVGGVQVGLLHQGWRDDGSEIFEPIYAYRDAQIEEHVQQCLRGHLAMWGHIEEARQRIQAKFDERIHALKAELASIRAEVERIEAECGYTAATEEAEAAYMAVRDIEARIVAFVPRTLAAAARQAAWIAAASSAEVPSYLEKGQFAEALFSIGQAQA